MFEKYEDVAFKKLKCIIRFIKKNVSSKHINTFHLLINLNCF